MPKTPLKLEQRAEDWWGAVDRLTQCVINHAKELRNAMARTAAGTTNKNTLVSVLPPGVVTSASYTWQWTLEVQKNRLRYSLWLLRLYRGGLGWQEPKPPLRYSPRNRAERHALWRYRHPKQVYNLNPNW
jgi:hypothetical protein